MPKTKLTDKERISYLEKELSAVRSHVVNEINKIKDIIGITDDYIHTPVKKLEFKDLSQL